MLKKMLFISLIIGIINASNISVAQEKLPIKQALTQALECNNELRAMKSSLSADERDIGISKSILMPKLRFEENFTSTNNPAQAFGFKLNQRRFTSSDLNNAPDSFNEPGVINNFLTGISFEQPLYLRKANIGISMAKRNYSAKGYDYLRKQEDIVSKVIIAYLQINTSEEFANVAIKALNEAKEHLKVTQVRYTNGLGLYSDILRATTEVNEAEQNLLTAKKNVNLAKRALGLLLGVKTPVEIAFDLPDIKLNEINYYYDYSDQRNDLKAWEVRVDNAKNNIKLAQSDIFPTVGVGGAYQLYDHRAPFAFEGNNYIVSAFLKWDIFDGNKRKFETLKAKDQEQELKEFLEGFKKLIAYKIYESYLNVKEAQQRVELSKSSLKSAEEGKRLVLKRYENSLSTFVDLIDAQVNLDKTRANLVKSTNDYQIALVNLEFESGLTLNTLNAQGK